MNDSTLHDQCVTCTTPLLGDERTSARCSRCTATYGPLADTPPAPDPTEQCRHCYAPIGAGAYGVWVDRTGGDCCPETNGAHHPVPTADASVRRLDTQSAGLSAGDLPGKDEGAFTYGSSAADIAHDNYRRATFASVAVVAFAESTGALNEEPALAIGDLLADLHHLADCLGVAWTGLLDGADVHYHAEISGEG